MKIVVDGHYILDMLPFMELDEIQKLRKRIGWSQPEMARALGIAHGLTISHWETGFRVPKGMSARLLRFLDELPNDELRKVTKRLERLGMEESNAHK